jgi:hypothetical protein
LDILCGNEEKARMILKAYQHYALKAGEVLLMQNITTHAWNTGWSNADVHIGLRNAHSNGWITILEGGSIMLTKLGFETIREFSHGDAA